LYDEDTLQLVVSWSSAGRQLRNTPSSSRKSDHLRSPLAKAELLADGMVEAAGVEREFGAIEN
jgi:hypothetical protein